ncbi:MAG: ankyrin repeat domain-containing protein [Aliishimia sp.]
MVDFSILPLLTPIAAFPVVRCLQTAVGPAMDGLILSAQSKATKAARKTLGVQPPHQSENHDIQRALLLAYVRAGESWIAELEKLTNVVDGGNAGTKLSEFCNRVGTHLSDLESKSKNRKVAVEDGGLQPLIYKLIEIVPGDADADADVRGAYASATHNLTDAFKHELMRVEGEALPDNAVASLERREEGPIVYRQFGHNVVGHFLDILKGGTYPEATKAFEFRLFGVLRNELTNVDAKLDVSLDQGAKLDVQVETVRTELWKTRHELSVMGHQMLRAIDVVGEKVDDRLDELQAELTAYFQYIGALSLDRKPRHDVDVRKPFVNMRFEQRGTEFVGRTTELHQLHDFLNSEKTLAWWQVSGSGGQGKSRLGLRLIDTIGPDWHAGFLGAQGLDRDWNTVNFSHPTLIIVDYLAAPGKALKFVKAIEALARRVPGADDQVTLDAPPITQPVRFLVLERAGFGGDADASKGAANWHGMIPQGSQVAVTATQHEPYSLELQDLAQDKMIAIANSWRASPGRELSPLSKAQAEKLVNLMANSGQSGRQKAWRPLFAMMLGERIDRFDTTLNADDAIEDILHDALVAEREEVWPKDDNGQPTDLSHQALNLACLTSMIGVYDHNSHAEILENAAPDEAAFEEFYGAFDASHLGQTNMALGYRVQSLSREGVAPLVARQPDLLAEYQVLLELSARPLLQRHRKRLARLAADAFRLAPSDLIAFFVRLAEDFPKHATARALFDAQLPADALSTLPDQKNQTKRVDDLDLNLPSYFGLNGFLRAYLANGANFSKRTSNGGFPLQYAAQEGHAEIVAHLIKAGANVDAVDPQDGAFPLLMAAHEGHAEIVAHLIKAGANVDAVDPQDGGVPLLMAAQEGHAEIVAHLIKAGANVDAMNAETGGFPLLMAAQEGHAEIVAHLIKAGTNVDAMNAETGTFPLLMAAQNGHAETVAHLIKAGADPTRAHEKTGLCAIDLAIMTNNGALIELFAEALSCTTEDLLKATQHRFT